MTRFPYLAATSNKPKKFKALRNIPEDQELLSTAQVRKILGVCFTTVKNYIERGYITCIFIGERRFFYRQEIENLIKHGRSSRASNDNTEAQDD